MSQQSPYRPNLLQDKVALITGGGSGICNEIARQMGLHGATIAIMGRRRDVLDEACKVFTSEGIKCSAHNGDVRIPEDCQRVLSEVKTQHLHLDILVNGAAGNFLCPPEKLSPNGFKTVMDIDVNGTFNMSIGSFELLKESKGIILNISATLHYQGTSMQAHVSAAKAAVDALTINLASEWGPRGIRVCGIAPGPIADTEGMRRLGPMGADKAIEKTTPLRRLGTRKDIAYAAVFLVSEAASYITGETMVVDGGQWLYKPEFVPREIIEKMMAAGMKTS